VLLAIGCHRRQTVSRLVYVRSQPPAVESRTPSAQAAETIVISEPPAPEPEAKPPEIAGPAQEPAPKHPVTRRRPVRPDAPAEAENDLPAETPPTAEVPPLEPRESQEKQAQLRREIAATREDAQKRITRLERLRLAAGDRKTLNDARTFLAQSARELQKGELVRSISLAHKAALLVSAVEQSH
jgi:outer membrane biosynthesis protein TonB